MLSRVVDAFYGRILRDETLNRFFQVGVATSCAIIHAVHPLIPHFFSVVIIFRDTAKLIAITLVATLACGATMCRLLATSIYDLLMHCVARSHAALRSGQLSQHRHTDMAHHASAHNAAMHQRLVALQPACIPICLHPWGKHARMMDVRAASVRVVYVIIVTASNLPHAPCRAQLH